ncbi:MAG: DUF6438 domain-containing protein [Brevundimonas sp.]|uniref:DUF6438 domain-containing protein n=1 Tax=Brevundimonas sp. TaxID=1871086 RepID=UPI003001C5EE
MPWRTLALAGAATVIGLSLALTAPGEYQPLPEGADLSLATVSLIRTSCFGTCPHYWVTVRGDGQVRYCGVSNVLTLGRQSGTIPARDALALIRHVETSDFLSLNDEYESDVTDNPTYVLVLRAGGVEKHVHDYAGVDAGMPPVVRQLQDDVDRVSRSSQWVGSRAQRQQGGTGWALGNWEERYETCFGPMPETGE